MFYGTSSSANQGDPPTMATQEPAIDFTRLSFPSDDLSIRHLRAVEAQFAGDRNGFAQEEPAFFESEGKIADVASTLFLERALAHKAFAAALGKPDPHPDDEELTRSEAIRMLGDCYEGYRLSSGVKHTQELVRDIEAQAVAQAREYHGRAR
jgi:hypothetical protein